jgi:hypothetical protein
MIIFYSWQKDLPNNTNLSFIETALKKAVRNITSDDSIQVELAIDRDTSGVPGSPEIPKVVLSKIDKCDIFLCDLSIINRGSKFKATPNPNVLFELGYALRKFNDSDSLDWKNIIMVMNTAFVEINKLPFDLDKRRVIPYSISENAEDKATERKVLESKLDAMIRSIIKQMPVEEVVEVIATTELNLKEQIQFKKFQKEWKSSSNSIDDVKSELNSLFDKIIEYLNGEPTERTDNQLSFEAHNLEAQLVLSKHNHYGTQDAPINYMFIIQVYQSNSTGKQTKLNENFSLDVNTDRKVGWSRNSQTFLTSTEIYEKLIKYLAAILNGDDAKF